MDETGVQKRRMSDAVTSHASLVEVRLKEINAKLLKPRPKLPLGITSDISQVHDRIHSSQVGATAIVYDTEYKFVVHDGNQDDIAVAELTISTVYKISEDRHFSRESLNAFGQVANLDVIHPYVREILHSLTGRLGIPPLILDLKTAPYLAAGD